MRGTAAIAGGGIGGLATAAALHTAGWRVTLFEREPGLSGAGTAPGLWPAAVAAPARLRGGGGGGLAGAAAGVGLGPAGVAALERGGVGDAARRAAVPQQSARILRAD